MFSLPWSWYACSEVCFVSSQTGKQRKLRPGQAIRALTRRTSILKCWAFIFMWKVRGCRPWFISKLVARFCQLLDLLLFYALILDVNDFFFHLLLRLCLTVALQQRTQMLADPCVWQRDVARNTANIFPYHTAVKSIAQIAFITKKVKVTLLQMFGNYFLLQWKIKQKPSQYEKKIRKAT